MLFRKGSSVLQAFSAALQRLEATSCSTAAVGWSETRLLSSSSSKAGDRWGSRHIHAAPSALHKHEDDVEEKETISVTFTDDKDGSVTAVRMPLGQNLLEAAHANDVDLEGACEGSLACSTCHVIVEDPGYYAKIPEADDDENDMLDLAFGLTDTSRLGCQVKAAPELDGLHVRIPSATRNFAVDGHIPKPH